MKQLRQVFCVQMLAIVLWLFALPVGANVWTADDADGALAGSQPLRL